MLCRRARPRLVEQPLDHTQPFVPGALLCSQIIHRRFFDHEAVHVRLNCDVLRVSGQLDEC